MEIRLPVPFQPVLTDTPAHPLPAYVSPALLRIGWVQRQERRAEASGEGWRRFGMPRSVPASLAVKPERKWYWVDRQSDEKPAAAHQRRLQSGNNFSCVARFGNRLNDVIDVIIG